MKKQFMVLAAILIVALMTVYQGVRFVRYHSFTKYNIWPAQTIKAYLEKTYGGSYTLNTTNFYRGGPYHVWEFQYKDEDGLLFYEYYQAAYDGPNGLELYLNHRRGELDIIDLYWQAKLNHVFEKDFSLSSYSADCDFRMNNTSVKYSFDIEKKEDIDKFADIISNIYGYTYLHVKEPTSKILGCGITYQGKTVCEISVLNEEYDDGNFEKEEFEKYVKNTIETELVRVQKGE